MDKGLNNQEFLQVEKQGDYLIARELEQNELRQRGLAIMALGSVDMPYLVPVDPMDELNCDSCQ